MNTTRHGYHTCVLRVAAFLRILACGYFAIAAVIVSCPASAQPDRDPASLERRVKAAFLYKFVGYVQWPDGTFSRPDAPINIGILGDDQIANELAQLTIGRTVEGRSIAIRKLKEADALAGSHVLFIGRAEHARFAQVLKAAKNGPTLVITESEGALSQGSMINFIVADGRVRFEISLANAEKMSLRLSSRLLAVAQNVRTGTP
jgi:hypothetical protein